MDDGELCHAYDESIEIQSQISNQIILNEAILYIDSLISETMVSDFVFFKNWSLEFFGSMVISVYTKCIQAYVHIMASLKGTWQNLSLLS